MDTITLEKSQELRGFAHRLLAWYEVHARTMPWRVPPSQHAKGVRPDPYHIWLSEVMLQQTQVATVKSYFEAFTRKWPTIQDLARSDLDEVLKMWAGLGYYSRARNLKRCADHLVEHHGGRFPDTREGLMALPGIGDYTASAIASIAFDRSVVVMDGNVERVMARHCNIGVPFPAAKPLVHEKLENLLDRHRPGEFAQAMMDLGATLCTPKRPACSLCPVQQDCLAWRTGNPELLPTKLPKKKKPIRKGAAFVVADEAGAIFLCKRDPKGLLGGMTQVPTTNWNASRDGETGAAAVPVAGDWQMVGIARHTFTHFKLELEVWSTTSNRKPQPDGWWCASETLGGEALPTVIRKVLAAAGIEVRR